MAAKRELMTPKGDKRYVRRDAKGRIKEVEDVGRSLAQDRRRKSRKSATKGQGDKGDRTATTARKRTPSGTTSRKRTRAKPRKRARITLPAHRAPIVA